MDETHSIMMFDRAAVRPNQKTGPETVKSGDSGFFWMGSQPWLKVNADGRRFMNESGTYENHCCPKTAEPQKGDVGGVGNPC